MVTAKNIGGRREIALGALLLGVTVLAWVGVVRSADAMRMPEMEPLSVAAMLAFTLEWGVMMTAMMLPSAAPMMLLYARSSRGRRVSGERMIPPWTFAATYLVLWLSTGVPVYVGWVAVGNLAAHSPTFASAVPYAIAATLFAAGLYQLSPAKLACLRQCEAPADFLVRRWRSGYGGSLRLAAAHAAYCIGCCWALMVILVAGGAMSLPWVLAITLVVFAEKVLPGGERTAKIAGVILIAAALAVAVWPDAVAAFRPAGMH